MKKTIKTMLAFVAGALFLAGCENEIRIEEIVDDGAELVTLTAYQEGEDDETKAAIDATNSTRINWTAGDKINYFGKTTSQSMTLTAGEGTTSGTFQGSVTTSSFDCVLYPYQSAATRTYDYNPVITAEVPMTQYAVKNSFDPAAALMVGQVQNGNYVQFKNVMSYVKVTIPSTLTKCKQVSLKAKDAWTTVAGKVNINVNDASWSETSAKEGQAFVRLVPQNGDTYLTAGASYYIAILPQTMATGFELIFNDDDIIKIKQSASSSVVFGRSKTKKLGAIKDFTCTVVPQKAVVNVDNYSLKIASHNIGAASYDAAGDYFPWGRLRPDYVKKSSSSVSSSDWYYTNGNLTLYNSCPEGQNLTPDYDIAAMLWGGNWRLPTKEEWKENLTDAFIQNGLPKAGFYHGQVLNESSDGYYLSSTKTNAYHVANLKISGTTAQEQDDNIAYVSSCLVRPVLSGPELGLFVPGKFSVADGKTVRFTRGNLYCNTTGSSVSYGIEANQYTYSGSRNSDHVSTFYWTKTAAASYAQEYNDGTCTQNDKFWLDGSDANHTLTINGISGLYVLSFDEMKYLIKRKNNRYRALYKTVCGQYCLIICPDDFIDDDSQYKNSYTAEEWADAESKGFVCIPYTSSTGYNLTYWLSSTQSADAGSYIFIEGGAQPIIQYGLSRENCAPLRVVKVVE